MTWQDIQKKILELNEKIEETNNTLISMKSIIDEIYIRQEKITNGFDIRNLKDAKLENRMLVTPIETLLLTKFNKLKISFDMNDIYKEIPSEIEECNEYLNNLKTKYNYAIKLLTATKLIEDTSLTEYTTDNFNETEYAKFKNYELKVLVQLAEQTIYYKLNLNNITEQVLNPITEIQVKKIDYYLSDLDKQSKNELFLEYIKYSYDKNACNFINGNLFAGTFMKASNFKMNPNLINKLHEIIYNNLKNKILEYYMDMPIEDFFNRFDIDLEKVKEYSNSKKKQV